MRNRDGKAIKEVRRSRLVCLKFIGNPVLPEQFGGFDKAVQSGPKLSSILVIQIKSQRSSININFP